MSQSATAPARQEIGAALPDFSLRRIGGGQVSLQELLAGKKGGVVIFWSGTCSHCVRYDDYFNDLTARHPEIALVAVASRQGETVADIEKTIAERRLTFPILHDPTSATARAWFTQQTPRVFLMDANRVLLYRGAIDNFKFPGDPEYQAYLEPAIASFLDGEPLARTETASFGCAIQTVYYILPKAL